MALSLMTLNIDCQAALNHKGLEPRYTSGMTTTGARLRQLREQCKFNQEQIGEICSVSKGMVSQWENDIVTPPIERMIELRKKIHFKLDWLYCEDGLFRPEVEALYMVAEKLPSYAVTQLTKEGNSYAELIKSAAEQDNNQ